jgi:hypothetical protein
MAIIKYDCSWVGIDGGREGLWKEPIWKDVLRIIADHEGELVYDRASPIYHDLEKDYPDEAWRSQTADGHFRPLFRDYPNSWTRTGVLSLSEQRFAVTDLGRSVLAGTISKPQLLVTMFEQHTEESGPQGSSEKPFAILASGILEAPRTLATDEIYWSIMKNYRPGQDSLINVMKKKLPLIRSVPEGTPYRRLRSMLTLMRTAGVIASTRRGAQRFWSALDVQLLKEISGSATI